GVGHAEITDFSDTRPDATPGGGPPARAPARAMIWNMSRAGPGTQTLLWHPRSGLWSVVVMNADGGRGVDVVANAGATVPSLVWIASGLLIAGGVLLAVAILLIVLGVREPERREVG